MRIRIRLRTLYYALPLALFAPDALAWGLQTHVFFAQTALFALPLADDRFRRAAARLPRLALAGACLPDLALIGRFFGTDAFRRSHRWTTLRQIAATATSDEERSIALGYASHLLVDIVAHNHFVPEHEQRIADIAMVMHAVCEWAMDDFLRGHATGRPAEMLDAERDVLAEFVAARFGCTHHVACRAIAGLARADQALRRSGMPRLCRGTVRVIDRHLVPRFEAYVRETHSRLVCLEGLLAGATPALRADPPRHAARSAFNAPLPIMVPESLS